MGRNNGDFQVGSGSVRIEHGPNNMIPNSVLVRAVHSDPELDEVGYMELGSPSTSTGNREVLSVKVTPKLRRQGIATAMWNHAKAVGLNPQHSSYQQPDGKSWAEKVGD